MTTSNSVLTNWTASSLPLDYHRVFLRFLRRPVARLPFHSFKADDRISCDLSGCRPYSSNNFLRASTRPAAETKFTDGADPSKSGKERKKTYNQLAPRVLSWCANIRLREVGAGRLCCKDVMLQHLELLMLKASSYTWKSVRSFYAHIAKQVELCRLEFNYATKIRDGATIFFKHSDLRTSTPQPRSTISAGGGSSSGDTNT